MNDNLESNIKNPLGCGKSQDPSRSLSTDDHPGVFYFGDVVKMNKGFIKVWRKIKDSEIAKSSPCVREIWWYLLLEANHKDANKNGFVIKRGQCLRSYIEIRKDLSWQVGWRIMSYSKHQCEHAMKVLTSKAMITTRKTTAGVLITILNYDKYQQNNIDEHHTELRAEDNRNTTGTPHLIKQECKNKKKEENILCADDIYGFYNSKISPVRKSSKRAKQNISYYLKKYDSAALKKAVENYATTVQNSAPQFRKDPANFFGKNDQYFIDFLPENFESNEPPAPKVLSGEDIARINA